MRLVICLEIVCTIVGNLLEILGNLLDIGVRLALIKVFEIIG